MEQIIYLGGTVLAASGVWKLILGDKWKQPRHRPRAVPPPPTTQPSPAPVKAVAAVASGAEEQEADVDMEDFELPEDVYACAFVLANNATPGMYSFSPLKNKQMALMWFYLLFISFSQSFALVALTAVAPPSVNSNTFYVECSKPTSHAFKDAAAALGFVSSEECKAELDFAFAVEISEEKTVTFHKADLDTPFYQHAFKGGAALGCLQVICCIWVMTHSFFRDFRNVEALLTFRDFNRWFLPVKGEELLQNGWVFAIPFVQFGLSTAVVSVSWCMICGFDETVDVVLNSMAFTFISEVAEMFAEPVLKHYAGTAIAGLGPDYGTEPIYYIVTEYDEANASDTGWYVRADQKNKSGLLTDFKYRHEPKSYTKPNAAAIKFLRIAYFTIPPLSLLLCVLISEGVLENIIGPMLLIASLTSLIAFSLFHY